MIEDDDAVQDGHLSDGHLDVADEDSHPPPLNFEMVILWSMLTILLMMMMMMLLKNRL